MASRRSPIELKFNPYHDPRNGRFTFKPGGAGVGGDGASLRGEPGVQRRSPHDPRHPRNHTIYTVRAGDSLTKLAALRKGVTIADLAWLNDLPADARLKIGQKLMLPTQAYLDAGRDAKNRFAALDFYMQTHGGKLPPDVAHPPSLEQQINDPAQWRPIAKNGYRFDRDAIERTRELKGELRNVLSARSKRNQSAAGGPDRRASDDGGHYIAVRFYGPSEAFNHFAQDASFNRGAYRALENKWAEDLRQGHRVAVDIIPLYSGLSQRPYELDITWFVDGRRQFRSFPNGKRGG